MPPASVALILGSGPRIGAAVAEKFASNGYKVALASRKGAGAVNDKGFLSLQADFANVESLPTIFDAVETEFHSPPTVVVYNAGSLTSPPDKDSVLSIPANSVLKDFIVNTVSPYVAAQQAVERWSKMPGDVKKTFIYTGNITNVAIVPMPMMLNVGMGKAAAAYWLGTADQLYSTRGFRFFYADERHADGRLKGLELDGAAHGEFYAQLAEHNGNVPWHATFVKGKGYVKF